MNIFHFLTKVLNAVMYDFSSPLHLEPQVGWNVNSESIMLVYTPWKQIKQDMKEIINAVVVATIAHSMERSSPFPFS